MHVRRLFVFCELLALFVCAPHLVFPHFWLLLMLVGCLNDLNAYYRWLRSRTDNFFSHSISLTSLSIQIQMCENYIWLGVNWVFESCARMYNIEWTKYQYQRLVAMPDVGRGVRPAVEVFNTLSTQSHPPRVYMKIEINVKKLKLHFKVMQHPNKKRRFDSQKLRNRSSRFLTRAAVRIRFLDSTKQWVRTVSALFKVHLVAWSCTCSQYSTHRCGARAHNTFILQGIIYIFLFVLDTWHTIEKLIKCRRTTPKSMRWKNYIVRLSTTSLAHMHTNFRF